jgi:hypothetical protein
MKPDDHWAPYNEQALVEGWFMTNDSNNRAVIAKVDDPPAWTDPPLNYTKPKFESDDKAIEHVIAKAMQGSSMHAFALLLHGQPLAEDACINEE